MHLMYILITSHLLYFRQIIIKKVFIADNLSVFSDQVFALKENLSLFEVWMGTFCFTFQIKIG